MKKNDFCAMLAFLFCTIFSLLCEGCCAQPNNSSSVFTPIDSTLTLTPVDSTMRDSLYRVMIDAQKVKAEEIKLTNGTTKTAKEVAINVKSKYIPLVQFILSDPKIYRGDLSTYGNFMPCFKLTFIKKKEVCILNFDFGLKKWNICNGEGKQIKMFDLSSDDMLRFANMLFPDNELYKNLINTDIR